MVSMFDAIEARLLLSSPVSGPVADTAVTAARLRQRSPAVVSYPAAALFPAEAGATWRYRVGVDTLDHAVSGAPSTVKGTTRLTVAVTRDGQAVGSSTYALDDRGVRLLSRSLQLPGSTEQESYADGVTLLPATARTGRRASSRSPWQGVADAGAFAWSGSDRRTLRVVGMQTVTVAAGSFRAMLVRETRQAGQFQTGGGPLSVRLRTTTLSWYAPGVGLVRSVTTTHRAASYNGQVVESAQSRVVRELLQTNRTYQPPRPDLVTRPISDQARQLSAGRRLRLSAVVTNAGQDSAAASTLTFYVSPDRNVDFADTAVAAASIKRMTPGQSRTRTVTINLPRRPGAYFVASVADAANQIAESDKTNNWSKPVKVVIKPR